MDNSLPRCVAQRGWSQIVVLYPRCLAEGRDATQIMEALIQHVRALLVGKVAPDADELKVYDAFKAEFLAQAESIDFNELNQYVRSAQSIMNDAKQMGLVVLIEPCGSINRFVQIVLKTLVHIHGLLSFHQQSLF